MGVLAGRHDESLRMDWTLAAYAAQGIGDQDAPGHADARGTRLVRKKTLIPYGSELPRVATPFGARPRPGIAARCEWM